MRSKTAIGAVKGDERSRSNAGFSLTEMLVTTLIMVMVTAMVATGIPVATETYAKTVNAANAQAVLSTTLAAIRSELGMASDVIVKVDEVYYLSGEGCWAKLCNDNTDELGKGVRKQYLTGSPEGDDVTKLSPDGDAIPLVPDASITDEIRVSYQGVLPGIDAGVVTFGEVSVTNGASELASVENYKIQTRSNG